MSKTDLCLLFEKYGSDKCDQVYHTYSRFYHALLLKKRNSVQNFLEIGIGTRALMVPIVGNEYKEGASLKAWRDFFPNATVYGLDIDTSVLFEDDRIKCYSVDQSQETSLKETTYKIFQEHAINSFDVIVDDGSHILEHMLLSLNIMSKFLSNDGIYIVEDIKDHEVGFFLRHVPVDLKIVCVYTGNYGKLNTQDNFVAYRKI